MNPKIIFEDDTFIVLNKPTGWITNEASTTKDQPVVQTWLRQNHKYPISEDREYRNGIVHRLDKETSGILLVAKTPKAFKNLQKQFKERQVEKEYIALAQGKVEPKSGEINVPVGRLPWRKDRFGALPGGRKAVTFWEVLEYYKKGSDTYSLLRMKPKTGRTHQIRIHLKHLGHPIVSDDFYAGRKTAKNQRSWCPRLFLHAGGIAFNHPDTDKKVSFESDLPDDLALALNSLEKTH